MTTLHPYAGTATLLRLGLRRDRVMATFGVLAPAIVMAGSAKATYDLYPPGTPDLTALAAIFATPAARALYGAPADATSIDALSVVKSQVSSVVILLIVLVAVVRRHTRGDEESGRLELVGAGAVGRRAPLTAAVLEATGLLLVSVLATVLGLVGAGLDGVGSVAFGLDWVGLGLATIGITAVAAQLAASNRTVGVIVAATLGGAYLLRAVADVGTGLGWLRWLTPFGWNEEVSAYGHNRMFVVLVPLAFAVAALALAYGLQDRRDLGAGLLPERPGPAHAAAGLDSPLALAWRLQRGTFVAWLVGTLVMGVVVGSMGTSATDMLSSPATADLFRKMGVTSDTLVNTFFAAFIKIMSVYAAAFGVLSLLRLHTEEDAGRLEPVLATATSRTRVLGAAATIALVGTVVLSLAGGVALGVAGAISLHQWSLIGSLAGAALASTPAALVVVAVAALLIGWAPRWALAAWAVFAAAFFVADFGRLVGLPNAVVGLSPWDHVPSLPGGALDLGPLLLLLLVGVVFVVVADVGFRRRDIA